MPLKKSLSVYFIAALFASFFGDSLNTGMSKEPSPFPSHAAKMKAGLFLSS